MAVERYPEFPEWVPPSVPKASGARSSTLNRTQTTNAERRVMLAADGAPVPILYGRVRVAPLIGAVTTDATGSTLIIQAIWGVGEIEAVEAVYIDGELAGASVTLDHYTGTTTQAVDETLEARVTDYADTLVATTPGGDVGVAYSVIQVPASASDGWPRIEGIIQGRKVYDPRTTTTVYSTNPALHLADFLSSSTIGMGQTVNWTSADAAADACDAAMSDASKRREAGVVLDRVAEASVHAEVLRTYAGCLIVPSDSGLKLVPNRPASVSRALTADHVLAGTLRLSRPRSVDVPTRVEVTYTDTGDTAAWDDAMAVAEREGVSTGALPRRVARVRLPGIQTHAQAYREALERLNAAYLTDLLAAWVTTDEALADEAGDVITLTHPVGLDTKKLRIVQVQPRQPGRWEITAEEYDEAVYSDAVVAAPTYADTSLPSPLSPPTPNSPTMVEELFTDETGTTYSRMRVTWTGSAWPYARQYRVVVTGSSVVVDTLVAARGTDTHTVVTPPVTQDVSYTAEVWIVSSVGAVSATPSSNTATAVGKLLPPTDVSSISGFEAGQFVALSWSNAADIDLRGYQIRRIPAANYVGTSADWTHANTVTIAERVDATTFLAFSQPVGSFYYGVKALDSVGNESTNAAWTLIEVTADAAAGTGFTTLDAHATLTNMHVYSLPGVSGSFAISSGGETWAQRFGTAGTAWSTGGTTGKLWAQEHGTLSGGCVFQTEEWDTTVDRVANWAWSGSITEYGSASASNYVSLAAAADYPTFTDVGGTSANRSARYMKAKVTATCSGADDVILVELPITASRQGKVITQTGTETVGTSGVTVTFDPAYSEAPSISLVAEYDMATRAYAVADNITATSFDIYLIDWTGTLCSGTARWTATGS